MKIIPVLDLKGGQAVHAVAGQRDRYRPVQGVLGSGTEPLALAAAYRARLGCHHCYVADLDAIAGRPGHNHLLPAISQTGLSPWVDAGVSTPAAALALTTLDVSRIIIGSETLASMDQLERLVASLSPNQLVLSVDLLDGVLRAPPGIDGPRQLVAGAARLGLRQIILLDLARVGAAAGPPLDLLAWLRPSFPELAFYAGGGVRHRSDLAALAQAGAAGALVATAFHRGNLTAADIRLFQS